MRVKRKRITCVLVTVFLAASQSHAQSLEEFAGVASTGIKINDASAARSDDSVEVISSIKEDGFILKKRYYYFLKEPKEKDNEYYKTEIETRKIDGNCSVLSTIRRTSYVKDYVDGKKVYRLCGMPRGLDKI